KNLLNIEKIKLVKGDLLKIHNIEEIKDDFDIVFHLAANPEVKMENPDVHFEENIHATYNLLEFMRKKNIKNIVFTSTSTVYGEPKIIPTPEDYAPLMPISLYGASKLACENLITAYCHNYDFKAVVLRLANVIGYRSTLSVVVDFVKKLKINPKKLEILGDGTQDKSYLYIDDCVDAILVALNNSNEKINIFNIGSEDKIKVIDIAKIVTKELGLKNVEFYFTGGVDGGRGWKGDVKLMQLSIEKIKKLGWKPKYKSKEAIEKTADILK
ncbi:MAG: NAD-dependent epimerase/dehydratase family protein, partial [Spirochaetota bacterium]|nr:NAD-dependent epimerase/dehydratase family protein [Spirochaetota bacterium]